MSDMFDGVDHLYAEQLGGKRHVGQITKIDGGIEFHDPNSNQKKVGFNVHVSGLVAPLGAVSGTVRRQLAAATGTTDTAKMIGKWIELFTENNAKSVSGKAIRITPEPATPPAPASKEQVEEIEALVSELGKDMAKVLTHVKKAYGAGNLSAMTEAQANKVLGPLRKAKEQG